MGLFYNAPEPTLQGTFTKNNLWNCLLYTSTVSYLMLILGVLIELITFWLAIASMRVCDSGVTKKGGGKGVVAPGRSSRPDIL